MYDSHKLRTITNIKDEAKNISNNSIVKQQFISWLECEIFILALTDSYDIPEYIINSIRNNWHDSEFDSRDLVLDETTNCRTYHRVTEGFIISNNSIDNEVCVHINNVVLLGYNKNDLLNANVSNDFNNLSLEYVRCGMLNHLSENTIINEAKGQLHKAVNIMNEYINKPNLERQDLCRFEEDPRIQTQQLFSTVRFTFRNYAEAIEVLRQVLMVKHADNFMTDDWIEKGLAYPNLYEYGEAVILKKLNEDD